MIVLHIEHQVAQFENWKASFDSYAELRQKAGVRRYQISRLLDNPDIAQIDLEFDTLNQAETLLNAVQQVWAKVGGTLIHNPQWRLSEVVETQVLRP